VVNRVRYVSQFGRRYPLFHSGAKSANEWPVRQDRRAAKRGQRPGHAMIRPGDAGSSWRGRHAAVNAAIRAASHHIDPQHIRHKLCGGSLNAVGVFAGRHKGGVTLSERLDRSHLNGKHLVPRIGVTFGGVTLAQKGPPPVRPLSPSRQSSSRDRRDLGRLYLVHCGGKTNCTTDPEVIPIRVARSRRLSGYIVAQRLNRFGFSASPRFGRHVADEDSLGVIVEREKSAAR
jgi:hypothetical protein